MEDTKDTDMSGRVATNKQGHPLKGFTFRMISTENRLKLHQLVPQR